MRFGISLALAALVIGCDCGSPPTLASPSTPPAAAVGQPYNYDVGGAGLSNPTWQVDAGSLPPGLTLAASGANGGVISGTPTTAGSYPFTLSVYNTCAQGTGASAPAKFTIVVSAPAANQPLTVTSPAALPEGSPTIGYSQQLTAIGGSGTYQWAVVSGALPAGLSLSASGAIAGTPTSLGTAKFTAQVTSGTATASQAFTLLIGAPLTITTVSPLPEAIDGVAYSVQLMAAGGVGNYTWSLIGGAFPPGIQGTASGLLSGTPPTDGTANPGTFTVQVTSGTATATRAYYLAENQIPLIFVSTSPLPAGAVNTAYSFQFVAASGGGGPGGGYHYKVTQGALPTGLTLSDPGLLSGTPTTAVTADAFTVQVKGGVDSLAAQFQLTVQAAIPPVLITSSSPLPNAVANVAYSYQLTASGGPTGQYAWAVAPGSGLPTWLSLSTGGLLTGTAPTGATSPVTFTITAADGGFTGVKQFQLTIQPTPPVVITSTSPLPNATVGSAYSYQLTATGGPTGHYLWALAAGSNLLPDGLLLSTSGQITGTPTTATTTPASFSIVASDGAFTGEMAFQLTVQP